MTLNAQVIRRLDDEAKRQGVSRSFLAEELLLHGFARVAAIIAEGVNNENE